MCVCGGVVHSVPAVLSFPCTVRITLSFLALTSKGPAIEVTEKMVESVTFLVWTAEANSIKRAMEPSEVHDAVCKVASSTRVVVLLT